MQLIQRGVYAFGRLLHREQDAHPLALHGEATERTPLTTPSFNQSLVFRRDKLLKLIDERLQRDDFAPPIVNAMYGIAHRADVECLSRDTGGD